MGIAKNQSLEVSERGWRDPGTRICVKCVGEDEFLKSLIRKNLADQRCSYCGAKRRKSAPLSVLMDALLRGLKRHFNDEASAGCPYDSEIEINYSSSRDALYQLLDLEGVEWPNGLVSDVADCLENTGWVDAPDGDWMGSFQHERLFWSWESFSNVVKHVSRFHFQAKSRRTKWHEDPISPQEMLPFLGKIVRKNRLIRKLSPTLTFFRARVGIHECNVDELGPPPRELTKAGRMNPAGIAYLYLAFDRNTAFAEIRVTQKEDVTISKWQPNEELNVLDLTALPKRPSIFSNERAKYDLIQFLYSFVHEIQRPIEHDGYEHIGYVPTQVVSEYFAQVFRFGASCRIDGIVYPSSINQGGKNLVLFPDNEALGFQFERMKLVDSELVTTEFEVERPIDLSG